MCARKLFQLALVFSILLLPALALAAPEKPAAKPGPDEVMKRLALGNARFLAGKAQHPNTDQKRLALAGGKEGQARYAIATVLSCSDSRVPVERIFDAGVMDLFVVRVAGNVCHTDELGSIEYGLAQMRTPVLVVLGHTQCDVVATVTDSLSGRGRALERNIPPLVAPIVPAVKRAMAAGSGLAGDALVARAIEENVWQSVEDLLMKSAAVRELYKARSVKIVGALYDVGTGKATFLPEAKVVQILKEVEANPARAMNAMAEPGQEAKDKTVDKAEIDRGIQELSRSLQDIDGRVEAKVKDMNRDLVPALQALQGKIEERALRQHRETLLALAALGIGAAILFLVLLWLIVSRTRRLAAQQERLRGKPRGATPQQDEKVMQFRDQ